MKQYHDLLQDILDNGIESEDRTGVGTFSLMHKTMKFDLSEGFPLVSTKKIYWKGVVEELLYFIGGVDNNNILKEKGVKIWNSWGDKNGNLGPMYGHQLRNFGGKYKNIPQPEPEYLYNFNKTNALGKKIYKSKGYGDFIVLNKDGKNCEIEFIFTGYKKNIRNDKLKNLSIYDPFYPKVKGVAYLGEIETTKNLTDNEMYIYRTWVGMISRCYNEKKDTYKYYGGKGVYVCNRWLNFSNFLKDYKLMEGYNKASIENLEIDKDKYGDGFCYSPETCSLMSKEENINQTIHKAHLVENKETQAISYIRNSSIFRDTNGIKNQGNFNSMTRGKRNTAEGWSLIKTENKSLGKDQLLDTINSIKNNPNSRRHVITLWNPSDLNSQALACCHGTVIQFYVKRGKLSCSMYQRSADTLLGVPFNIASYALLTHMIAQVCNLQPGHLFITTGDTHIYKNHIEQVKLQLTREEYPLPTLWLNPEIKDIDDFTYEDIKLVGYKSHPSIKADVAV